MSKVLVTGHLGFLGSHLVDKLLENGHQVYGIDDLSGGSDNNKSSQIMWHGYFDLRDAKKTDANIKLIRPDIVFHLAANAAENKAQFSPIDITSRNYSAFINTLTPFIKYGGKRFVFTSSIAVYGALQTPFKETDDAHPEDLYGISKLACEQALKVMSKVHGFEHVIARPHNVVGERQNVSDPYRNVVTIIMNTLRKSYRPYIYGDGEQKRCFSYVGDVVEALYKCGFEDVSGMTFNIGSDELHTINELYRMICQVLGFSTSPTYLSDRPQEVKEAIADHTQAKKYLQYEDKTSLREALEKTWNWLKEKPYIEPKYDILELESPLIPKNWLKI